MLETLLERFRRRDRLALARLVSLAARGEQVEEILAGIGDPARPARVVAFTGSGGVGKSTLVGKLIEQVRGQGQSVAVLACDPQSPLSGGALLGDRFRRRDRLALARLVSLTARGEQVEEILAGIGEPARPARVVAFTGSGGVGKSTLVGKLIEQVRGQGQSVAVLACDPQSPLSGGALLGDRFRMPARPDDDGVFIRSLAAAGGHGALAEHLDVLIRLLEVFGFDVIFIETVGAGQGDTLVRELVDVLVLLLQPEMGDDLQWEKAGLLEVADAIAIHKADLPGAERVETQVRATLALSASTGATPVQTVPILRVSSRSGEGINELWQTIAASPLRRGRHRRGRDLLRLAQQTLAARFAAEAAEPSEVRQLIVSWQHGEISSVQAASALVKLLANSPT